MSNLVINQVSDTVKVLATLDTDTIQKIINRDKKIDRYQISIEESCIVLQIKHQLVAKDLRFVHTVSILLIHLERIGDLAVNIARIIEKLKKQEVVYKDNELKTLILEMANLVYSELNKSIKAFNSKDYKLASRIDNLDDNVDKMEKIILRKLNTSKMESESDIKRISNLALVLRYLERIGDHAVTIGEDIIYLKNGDYRVFHSGN